MLYEKEIQKVKWVLEENNLLPIERKRLELYIKSLEQSERRKENDC